MKHFLNEVTRNRQSSCKSQILRGRQSRDSNLDRLRRTIICPCPSNVEYHEFRHPKIINKYACLDLNTNNESECFFVCQSAFSSKAYHLCATVWWVSSFMPSDRMHLGFFTPWSLHSPLHCQRSSGCNLHVQCYCSSPKLRVCGPL